ncbi:MAG: hypothetical protein RMM31_08290 [Anaerolineae bacterium]|nr:hypothetical protein [Anaerolineae bacterium]
MPDPSSARDEQRSACLVGKLTALIALLSLAVLAVPSRIAAQSPNPYARIALPASNQVLRGTVTIQGTATHPAFVRYELAYAREPELSWIPLGGGVQPVENGVLGGWNTRPIQPGSYALRLQVFAADGSVSESVVRNLTIEVAASPTPDTTQASATQRASVSEFQTARTVLQAVGDILAAAPRAFLRGVQFAGAFFAALGGYLLLRRAALAIYRRYVARPQPYRD